MTQRALAIVALALDIFQTNRDPGWVVYVLTLLRVIALPFEEELEKMC